MPHNDEQISLNKYISSSGFCSRREADKLIEQGRVTVNDRLAQPGAKVHVKDTVEVDGEPIKTKRKESIYIACNKPIGVTSTTDPKDKTNIVYFLNHPKRIFPIGRLDKDSDGLIFLTNDGDIVNKILRASNNHEKEYVVSVNKAITPEFIKGMGEGVPILGTVTRKCFVKQEGNRKFRIILVQGLNRQIRRMCEHFGYEVTKLTRVRIMNVNLDNLQPGKWRYLTAPEVDKINDLVATSSKTDEKPSLPKKPTTHTRDKKEGTDRADKNGKIDVRTKGKAKEEKKHGKPLNTDKKRTTATDKPAKQKMKDTKRPASAKPKEQKTQPENRKGKSYKEWRDKR